MNSETALITGASSGIGLHLAREFASHGHPLILVAPVAEELDEIAFELQREFDVDIKFIARDLRDSAAPHEIFDTLEGQFVHTLVNDAGLGQHGKFWEYPLEKDISMIRLNVEAVVRLTKLFLQPMLSLNQGRILNVASISGFLPGPYLAIYHATKAFILSFSEALATELGETAITLTALCPGPTDTDFFLKSDSMNAGTVQKLPVMSPQDVAVAGYQGLINKERIIVPGTINKAMVFSRRFMPEWMQAKMTEKLGEDVPPEQRKFKRGDKEFEVAESEAR